MRETAFVGRRPLRSREAASLTTKIESCCVCVLWCGLCLLACFQRVFCSTRARTERGSTARASASGVRVIVGLFFFFQLCALRVSLCVFVCVLSWGGKEEAPVSSAMEISLDRKLGMALDDLPSVREGKAPRREGGGKAQRNERPSGRSNRHNPVGGGRNAAVGSRVFVGNLDWRVSWQDLKDLGNTVGTVRYADVMQMPDGKSKGCGIIEFASAADAKRAIQRLNDHELNGRPIFVREDREAKGAGTFRGGAGARNNGNGSEQGGGRGGTKVYVGNLPFDTSWQTLKDFMRLAGKVLHADVPQRDDGKPKGFGLVEFENANFARRACETLNGAELDGRPLTVRMDKQASLDSTSGGYGSGAGYLQDDRSGSGGGGNTKVFVGNLSFDTSWQDLKDFMRSAGNVVHADVPQRPDGKSKGFGLVTFETAAAARRACQSLDNEELDGRQLQVRLDAKADGGGGGGGARGGSGTARNRGPSGCRVHVGNIPWSLRWTDLKDYLRDEVRVCPLLKSTPHA